MPLIEADPLASLVLLAVIVAGHVHLPADELPDAIAGAHMRPVVRRDAAVVLALDRGR